MKKKLIWQLPFLTLLIVGTILILRKSSQDSSTPYHENKGVIFGTSYSVKYQSAKDFSKLIVQELEHVDMSLSPFNEKSIISAVNHNRPVKVDSLFTDVFRLAMDISRQTDGAFDITVAPLVNAWGFGFKGGTMPDMATVDSLRAIIGYKRVKLTDEGVVVKDNPQMMLDCSAIAKGYGVDRIARLLQKNGVENYMVEIGGEVVTKGINPRRQPWRIGITTPTDDSLAIDNEVFTVINVTDMALATSGNYRNFYYRGGRKYAHTISPDTGYPVSHSLLSATVIAPDCATADAYATAFMVMGMERAKEVLSQHPELMAYLIYSAPNGDLATWYSPQLSNKIGQQ